MDSSVILAEVFGNRAQASRSGAIDKFHGMFSFERCISKTIKQEIDDRVPEVITFTNQISKGFTTEFFDFKTGSPSVALSDLAFFESFFLDWKDKLTTGSTEREIIEDVEFALAVRLAEDHQDVKLLRKGLFTMYITMGFDKIVSEIMLNFDAERKKYSAFYNEADPSARKKLEGDPRMKKTVRKKPKDIDILCEVAAYQKSSGKKCILATTDRADFLNNRSAIKSLTGVSCVDPVYLPMELEE